MSFVVLAIIDEPKGNKSTFNYATGGWVAAPVVGRVVQRMGPLFGMAPMMERGRELEAKWRPAEPAPAKPLFVAVKEAIADVRGRQLAAN